MDSTKDQSDLITDFDGSAPGLIGNSDTLRAYFVPPGQSCTQRWPVPDVRVPPAIDQAKRSLCISGMATRPIEWKWKKFLALTAVNKTDEERYGW